MTGYNGAGMGRVSTLTCPASEGQNGMTRAFVQPINQARLVYKFDIVNNKTR